MKSDYYGDFYESEEWKKERERVLKGWNGLCNRCNKPTDSPHVHHVYSIDIKIYEILCPDCHADHHGDDKIATFRKKPRYCTTCKARIKWYQDPVTKEYWVMDYDLDNICHNCTPKLCKFCNKEIKFKAVEDKRIPVEFNNELKLWVKHECKKIQTPYEPMFKNVITKFY